MACGNERRIVVCQRTQVRIAALADRPIAERLMDVCHGVGVTDIESRRDEPTYGRKTL